MLKAPQSFAKEGGKSTQTRFIYCLFTVKFETPLVVSGEEKEDLNLKLAFSTNNSFEWTDTNGNGTWDFDMETGMNEPLVDMGLRGFINFKIFNLLATHWH